MLRRTTTFVKNTPLLWALVPLLAFYAIIFSQKWIPTHDSQALARMIHILVGHLSAFGEYPLWLPFMSHGVPSKLFHFTQLSPSVHFLTPVIQLFENWNSVSIYYLSLLIDEIIFMGGVYVLARFLYNNLTTALFVTLALTGSVIVARQPFFNFGNVYYLPLCCYFIISGFAAGKAFRVGVGWLIFFSLAGRGYGVYPSIMSGVTLAIFTLLYLFSHRNESANLFRNCGRKEIWIAGLIMLPLALTVLLQQYGVRLPILSRAFDVQGEVNYFSFLENQWNTQLISFTEMALGILARPSTIEYAGICLVPYYFLALVFPIGKRMIPFLGVTFFLFLFWMGRNSFVAPFLFFVPTVSLYRHGGHVGALLKLFMVLTAGFGFDTFMSLLKEKDQRQLRPFLILSLGLFAALFSWDLSLYSSLGTQTATEKLRIILFTAILVMHLNLLLSGSLQQWVGPLLLWVVLVDVYSFRFSLYHQELLHVSDDIWNLFQIRKTDFQPQRSFDYYGNHNFSRFSAYAQSENEFTRHTLDSCITSGKDCKQPSGKSTGELYDDLEQFLGFDPCFSILRSEVGMPRIADVQKGFGLSMGLRFPISQYENGKLRSQIHGSTFRQVTGCETSKFSLRSGIFRVPDQEKLIGALVNGKATGNQILVKEADWLDYQMRKINLASGSSLQEASPDADVPVGNVQVSSFSFNSVKLVATVKGLGTNWLYYADAWHPFWKAYVNGRPVPILPANHAYKAIEVPQGTSQIEFKFESPISLWLLKLNSWFCVLTVSLILSWLGWGVRFENLLHRLLLIIARKKETRRPKSGILIPGAALKSESP